VAVLGCYAGVFGLVKLKGALSAKPPVPAAPVAAAAPAGTGAASKWGFEPPTIDTFDAWSANDQNWAAWEKFMSNDDLVNKWASEL